MRIQDYEQLFAGIKYRADKVYNALGRPVGHHEMRLITDPFATWVGYRLVLVRPDPYFVVQAMAALAEEFGVAPTVHNVEEAVALDVLVKEVNWTDEVDGGCQEPTRKKTGKGTKKRTGRTMGRSSTGHANSR